MLSHPIKPSYRIAFINNPERLANLCESLAHVSALALDIETVNWWNQQHERVALLQLAYRERREMRVAVIDTLARLDLTALRPTLESNSTTKAIHNAAFDATRLARHYSITTHPIFDTMLAARRNGERRYSLQAQAAQHLALPLDKRAQVSDWSLRPLSPAQLDYAARDAAATLMLYEHQRGRSLRGEYQVRPDVSSSQTALPLVASLPRQRILKNESKSADDRVTKESKSADASSAADSPLSVASLALLGIIAELPSRYSPEQLAVSLGDERVGLAGWIIDRMLGTEADVDEASAKMMIADLHQRRLINITPTRRMEASIAGGKLWQQHKHL